MTIVPSVRGWSDIMAADNGGDNAIYTRSDQGTGAQVLLRAHSGVRAELGTL